MTDSGVSRWMCRRAPWLLAGILAGACALRLYRLDAPLADYRAMRQAHTAAIARDCYRKGLDILAARPDALNYPEATDFPLYAWGVAALYWVTGGVREWLGRLSSVVLSGATIYLVYRWVDAWWGRVAALWAAFFFAFAPSSVFFGRAYMPEASMLLLMVCSFWAAARWHATGRPGYMVLGAVLLGLAVTVKLTPGMLLAPLAWLAYDRGGKKALFGLPGLLPVLCAVAPLLLWYEAASLAYLAPKSYDTRPGALTVHFYAQMLINRPGGVLLGPAAYPAFLVGLLAFPSQRRDYALHAWVAAAAAYFLVASRKNFALEYYNLPILPAACALAGRGMSVLVSENPWGGIRLGALLRRLLANGLACSLAIMYLSALGIGYAAHWQWETSYRLPTTREVLTWGALVMAGSLVLGYLAWWLLARLGRRAPSNWPLAVAVAAVALTAVAGGAYLAVMYRQRDDLVAAGRALAAVSAPEDKILEVADKSFVVLYYADRRGWYRFRKQIQPESIEELRAQGAAWLVSTLLDELEGDAGLRDYLAANYRVAARAPEFLIFDLRTRLADRPAPGSAGAAKPLSKE